MKSFAVNKALCFSPLFQLTDAEKLSELFWPNIYAARHVSTALEYEIQFECLQVSASSSLAASHKIMCTANANAENAGNAENCENAGNAIRQHFNNFGWFKY